AVGLWHEHRLHGHGDAAMRAKGMTRMSRLCAGLVASILVAGCGPTPAEVASGSRPYVGKPRPPVDVALVPGAALQSGVPGRLRLQVRSRLSLDSVRLVVEGDEGLAVVGYQEVPGTEGAWHQSAGEAASFEISATPMSGGTRYLSGFLSFGVAGMSQGVPFRLPVEVGGPVTVAPVQGRVERLPARGASGELIDSMPAETTVR
ncbi:MAG TPA: hypothetical protein VFG48_11610, partial [Xanthomonadales bacterium]|nr:hypothetical protein [Xanthomonadales bacterium]